MTSLMDLGGIIYSKGSSVTGKSLVLVYEGALGVGSGKCPISDENGFMMLSIKESDPNFGLAMQNYDSIRSNIIRSNGHVRRFNKGVNVLPEGFNTPINGLMELITGVENETPIRFISEDLHLRDGCINENIVAILAEESGLYNNGHSRRLESAFFPFRFCA